MSIRIKKYSSDDASKWDEHIQKSVSSHFMFLRNFMEYHSDRFEDYSLLFYKKDELISVLPANIEGTKLHSHQGLTFGGLISNKAGASDIISCFESLDLYAKEKGWTEIIYKSMPSIYRSLGEGDLYALNYCGYGMFRRDVGTTVDISSELKLRTDKKRNSNKGARLELIVKKEENLSMFWKIVEDMLEKFHGQQPTHSLEEIQLLMDRFPENIQHFLLSNKEGNPMGGALLFFQNDVVHVQYMNINDDGRKIGALDYLIVHLMSKYKDTHRYFSFGISTEDDGTKLNVGLTKQKEGFGGSSVVQDFFSKKF